MNAIISYSLVPLRLATFMGIAMSGCSLLLAVLYVVIKLLNWNFQAPGATTVVVLVLFFIPSVSCLFAGSISPLLR